MAAIIDYKAGNLTSVKLAFDAIGVQAVITSDPAVILSAERVVFPGVGAAGSAMRTLRDLGLMDVIRAVLREKKPFLGICLGTQIIMEFSEEDGGVACMGLLPGTVRRFTPASPFDKIPQMGWNAVAQKQKHAVFQGIEDNSEFYFVHSYYPSPVDKNDVLGETTYADVAFASVIGRGNMIATQFHPEKSGRIGLRFLENFSRWRPEC